MAASALSPVPCGVECHRSLARRRLEELFPEGRMPLTEDRVLYTARQPWVAEEVDRRSAHPSSPRIKASEYDEASFPVACLPSLCRAYAEEHHRGLAGAGGAPVTEATIGRAANQGWLRREHETATRAAESDVCRRAAAKEEWESFCRRVRAPPPDGHGDWYAVHREQSRARPTSPCTSDKPVAWARLDAQDVAHFIALARSRPDDAKVQASACRAVSQAASPAPPPLPGVAPATGRETRALCALLDGDGLGAVVAAMVVPGASVKLQTTACEALVHLCEAADAHPDRMRAVLAAGASKAVAQALERSPRERQLQRAGLRALARMAEHGAEREWRAGSEGERSVEQRLCNEVVSSTTLASVACTALRNHSKYDDVTRPACQLLWRLGLHDPGFGASHPGLAGLLERPAAHGVQEAQWLLEFSPWRASPKARPCHTAIGLARWGRLAPVAPEGVRIPLHQ
eukprot:TRINITY_DN72769_c0_g1_i1.p1 TRINITY_DN72769_c0_g1~~TRINITY_DN72769_c0_g1_i1.p1  ORF type:complete len:484 (-),score=79.83 TRINITY_DN72769_c0_g1_i1:155-1531(-)